MVKYDIPEGFTKEVLQGNSSYKLIDFWTVFVTIQKKTLKHKVDTF